MVWETVWERSRRQNQRRSTTTVRAMMEERQQRDHDESTFDHDPQQVMARMGYDRQEIRHILLLPAAGASSRLIGIQHVIIESTLNMVLRPARGRIWYIHSTRLVSFPGGKMGVCEDPTDEQDQRYL